jgi:chitodextrinase
VTTINEDGSASPGYAKVVAATARSDGWHDPAQFAIDNTVAATSNSIALDWVDPDREDSSTSDLSAFLITWQPPDGGGSVYTDKYDTYKIVTGLEPETTYSFNIVSVDESGNTSPGNYYITASTIALGGLLAPLDLVQVGQATQSAVSMTWIPAVATAPDTVESNVITAYDISADYYLPPQTLSGDTTSNYTYTNLSAGTEYRFSLVAFSAGFSAECATTFDATTSVSGAPSDPILSLTSIAYNNAGFSWNLSGNGRNGGVNLSSYFIEYYDTNAGPETALTKNPAGSLANRSTVIFGLTANTDYTFKVYARNVSGLISPGGTEATVEATTLELGAPFTPSNLQAHPYIPATSTSVTVMFNSAYKGPAENSEVTNHIVQISPPTSTDQGTFNIGLDTTLTISNLTEDTFYNVRVRAENADFILSPWSGSLGLTTSPAAGPGDVGGLRTSGLVDADSIPIAWTSPDEQGGGAITAYEVSYTS